MRARAGESFRATTDPLESPARCPPGAPLDRGFTRLSLAVSIESGMLGTPTHVGEEAGGAQRRVLEALKRHGPSTAAELVTRLGGGVAAMRAHLRALRAGRLVEHEEERRSVGRPVRRFRLTPRAEGLFPRHYELFALKLAEALAGEPTGGLEGILSRWEEELHRHLDGALPAGLAARAEALAAHQSAYGFMATAESRPEGVTLVERNCPILEIARLHPQVCRHEAALFGRLLDGSARLASCQALGDRVCAFQIAPRSAAESRELPTEPRDGSRTGGPGARPLASPRTAASRTTSASRARRTSAKRRAPLSRASERWH